MNEQAPSCEHCGEPQTLAPAIGYYCDKDGCFSADVAEAKKLVNAMRKKERFSQYLKLKKEFGGG